MNGTIKFLAIIGVFCAAVAGGVYLSSVRPDERQQTRQNHQAHYDGSRRPLKEAAMPAKRQRIPAHFIEHPAPLRPTLDPRSFSGRVREAYRAVREIPEVMAQLPCFCYCDESIRHESLHSCFEDEHGSRCAICLNEALTAYRLRKEQNLTAGQIREKIIEEYTE